MYERNFPKMSLFFFAESCEKSLGIQYCTVNGPFVPKLLTQASVCTAPIAFSCAAAEGL